MNASQPLSSSAGPRLQVQALSTGYQSEGQTVKLIHDVSFDVAAGETLALVGESGSGKSITSLTLMRLLARNTAWAVQGQAWFTQKDGRRCDLLALPEAAMRRLRGNQIAMIFQEPMTCLNPVLTIGEQIAESARLHLGMNRPSALAHAKRMLDQVEIPAAAQRLHEYPHQLSGGMRQRVMIAVAMTCSPSLLIADEPTTALDVTIQAQILALIARLKADTGMSVLFITHNLGVVAHHADRVAVMYAGRVVETAPVRPLFAAPRHPYTQGLLACLPGRARQAAAAHGAGRPAGLQAIPGQAPSPLALPPGCSFAPRCAQHRPACDTAMPKLYQINPGHAARCILMEQSA